MIYKYNAQELSEEAHKRANEELATLDLSSYDEITLSKLEYEIFRKHHNQVCIDDRNAILNAIGADISDVNTTPWLNCTLTAEQILAAEEYEKILGVFLCDDEHFINDPLVIQYNTTTTTKLTDDNSITTTTATDTTETTTTDTTTTTTTTTAANKTTTKKMPATTGNTQNPPKTGDSGVRVALTFTVLAAACITRSRKKEDDGE